MAAMAAAPPPPRPVSVTIAIRFPSSSSSSTDTTATSARALEECQILLVSSRKHHNRWVLPKGGIEPGETAEEAGRREAWEEAGIWPSTSFPLIPLGDPIPDSRPHKQQRVIAHARMRAAAAAAAAASASTSTSPTTHITPERSIECPTSATSSSDRGRTTSSSSGSASPYSSTRSRSVVPSPSPTPTEGTVITSASSVWSEAGELGEEKEKEKGRWEECWEMERERMRDKLLERCRGSANEDEDGREAEERKASQLESIDYAGRSEASEQQEASSSAAGLATIFGGESAGASETKEFDCPRAMYHFFLLLLPPFDPQLNDSSPSSSNPIFDHGIPILSPHPTTTAAAAHPPPPSPPHPALSADWPERSERSRCFVRGIARAREEVAWRPGGEATAGLERVTEEVASGARELSRSRVWN